jgi:hypothetical protein
MNPSVSSRSRRRGARIAIATLTSGAALLSGGQALAPAPALATMKMEEGENTCSLAPSPEEVSCPAGDANGGGPAQGGGSGGEVIVLPPVIVDPPSACPKPYTSCLPGPPPGGTVEPTPDRSGGSGGRSTGKPAPGASGSSWGTVANCKMIYRAAAALHPEFDDDTDWLSRLSKWWTGSERLGLKRYKRIWGEEGCEKILGKPFPQH